MSTFHDSHVVLDSEGGWKDGKRDGLAIIIFSVVCARFMNPMLLFGSGQQIEGKTRSRDEE